jgi:hypothetical protein
MGSIGWPELIVIFLVLAILVVAVVVVGRIAGGSKRPASGLVPCGACGKEISPRAPTCPNCGEPRQVLRG